MMNSKLLEPVEYYKSLPGKNIRSYITDVIGKNYNFSNSIIDETKKIVDTIHNCSLIIDDIEDNSTIRRGYECAHIKFTLPLSLNAGYMGIFGELKNINLPNINKILQILYELHEGQGMDIYWTMNKIIPSEVEYLQMIEYKTGKLFDLIIEIFYGYAQINEVDAFNEVQYKKLLRVSKFFSHYFQIRDDYINLTDPEYWKLKGYCEDLTEGKLSYLLIKLLENDNDNDKTVFTLLKNNNIQSKKEIIKILEKNDIFNKTYYKLIKLRTDMLYETHILNDIITKIDIKQPSIDVILGYDDNDVSVGESKKTDVIISDFDGTICNISSTYVYILFILNLICNSFSEKCLKYFKIIILLFLFPVIMIVNVIDSKYAGYISNYIIFNNLNVKQINETVKKIKPKILRKFNMPVINLINSYNTPHKYIISGNSIYILDLICNELNCTIYGSTMEFKENICIGKTINFYLNESKVKCINAILKDKNITNPNIIIFGNDENDYEMFKIGNINYVVNPSSKFLFKLKNLKYNKIIT